MSDEDLQAWLREMPGGSHPFATSPDRLYSPVDLYRGFDPARPDTLTHGFDARVARWLTDGELAPRKLSIAETIAARLHDTAIDGLVADFVMNRRPSVGMMGSHSISRDHPAFLEFAVIARELSRQGHLVISGGGPGLMEAANFGAFLAFMGVNLAVIREFFFRPSRERVRNGFLDFFVPGIAFLICLTIWILLPWKTWIIGGVWCLVGIIYMGIKTQGFRKEPIMIDLNA